MIQLRSLGTCVIVGMTTIHPALAQGSSQNPAGPPLGSSPGPAVPGLSGSGPSSKDAYPTATQCAEVQDQAQAQSSGGLSPHQQRLLRACEKAENQPHAAPGADRSPSEQAPR